MKYFYSDLVRDVSYLELIKEINQSKKYKLISNHSDYYLIFKDIIVSLLNDSEIVLIDSDLSKSEIYKFNISEYDLNKMIVCDFPDVIDYIDLINRIKNSKNWQMVLFTSGTTGIPKRVVHKLSNLIRMVKINEERGLDIWGFAYNPSHIAGVQVFFQALLNINHIVRLFNLPVEKIYELINKYNVTNISATPTFFRLLKNANIKFETVKRISSGGERFDNKLFNDLQRMFPNAKILNIYASTEFGTLFASKGENFVIKDEFRDKIKIYDSELFVHKSLLGILDENNLMGDWYKTGDKVEVLKENPLTIKILGRSNEFVNVGGYKVLITEVEEYINSIPGVIKSKVYSKRNSVLGSILVCEVEVNDNSLTETKIFNYLLNNLQPYKIPRIIKIVNEIETTTTGKIKR